jgi:glycosyltransferase involved in cell wall biosynthesis
MIPIVTIIMPVYNGEKYLKESIDSVLKQTFSNFELLIINDFSIDRSSEIIKSYNDVRIKLITNTKNEGILFTRNLGLTKALGKYIAILDCDDVAYRERLERQVSFLDKNKNCALIGSAVELIDENSQTISFSFQIINPKAIPSNLLFGNSIVHSSIMARKEILINNGGYSNFSLSEDYDLLVRISKKNIIMNLPIVLTKYRVHSSSISHKKRENMIEATKKIFKNQLHELDINPTEDELETHFYIGESKKKYNDAFLEKARIWMNRLKEANITKEIYDKDSFNMTLNKYWLKIFISSYNKTSIDGFLTLTKYTLNNMHYSLYNIYIYLKKYIFEKIIKNKLSLK